MEVAVQTYNQENDKSFLPDNLRQVILLGRQSLAPPEDILPSVWAERYRMLPRTSNISGKWTHRMTPHIPLIIDQYRNPEVEEITVQASAQLSKTEGIINNLIGYIIHIDPLPIMVVQSTLDMAKIYSREKLEPMIDDTPVLRERVAKKKKTDSDNTTLYKRFQGGFLLLAGAGSPHRLRQLSIAVVMSDDIDSIDSDKGEKGISEGDPIMRAEKRTKTFRGKRKKIRISTPTIKDHSRIEAYYKTSNMCKPYVPCPHCDHFQVLKFQNLKWEKEKDIFGKTIKHHTETVHYECSNCNGRIFEKDKFDMLLKMELRPDRPDIKKHFGLAALSELYSNFATWQEIADEFIKVKDNPEALEVFVNTTLGETYEKRDFEGVPEIDKLIEMNEDYLTPGNPYIPNGSLILCLSVDTQDNRLEVLVRAYGVDKESWLVHYEQFWGDPDQMEVWDQLDDFRTRVWTRIDGVRLGIAITFIDARGHRTQAVYNYCRTRQHESVYPINGRQGTGKILLLNRSRVGSRRVKDITLQNIGVDAGKEIILSRLKHRTHKGQSGPRVMHFTSAFCNADYFAGLLAEKPQRSFNPNTGYTVKWIYPDKNIRNEPLDLEVYNIAAMESLVPNFEATKINLDKQAEEIKKLREEGKYIEPVVHTRVIKKKLKLRKATDRKNPNIHGEG